MALHEQDSGERTSLPAVELVNVWKAYGQAKAVRGISLKVEVGEFVALLGPSGCGKTTTLRMVAGLERADAGDIIIDGQRVNDRPPYARAVGLMFQSYALFPHRTVSENIEFGLKYHGVPKAERPEKVRDALALVRLDGVDKRYPGQLSGGQQQRVALARAIVVRPKVLLLDEPLSNLDERLRDEMRNELKAIQRQVGLTFIYVTHDQHEALTLSDRVIVMRDGVIEQVGQPHDIYEQPQSRFVAQFLGRSNLLTGELNADGTVSTTTGLSISLPRDAVDGHLPGEHLTLVVRAENVRLHHGGGPGWPGTIMQNVYLGERNQFHVRLEGGQELIAITAGKDRHGQSDSVTVTVDPSDWVVIPEEGPNS